MIPLDFAMAGALLAFMIGGCFGFGITAIIVAGRQSRQDGPK